MKMREPSSADIRRTALTEKREREPGIVAVRNWGCSCPGLGVVVYGFIAGGSVFTVSWPL